LVHATLLASIANGTPEPSGQLKNAVPMTKGSKRTAGGPPSDTNQPNGGNMSEHATNAQAQLLEFIVNGLQSSL
jgi:hypothetical protein